MWAIINIIQLTIWLYSASFNITSSIFFSCLGIPLGLMVLFNDKISRLVCVYILIIFIENVNRFYFKYWFIYTIQITMQIIIYAVTLERLFFFLKCVQYDIIKKLG